MKRIWKAELVQESGQRVSMPAGAMPLAVHLQRGVPTMWFEVEAGHGVTDVLDHVVDRVMTGREVPRGSMYVGTTLHDGDEFVAHWYFRPAT